MIKDDDEATCRKDVDRLTSLIVHDQHYLSNNNNITSDYDRNRIEINHFFTLSKYTDHQCKDYEWTLIKHGEDSRQLLACEFVASISLEKIRLNESRIVLRNVFIFTLLIKTPSDLLIALVNQN